MIQTAQRTSIGRQGCRMIGMGGAAFCGSFLLSTTAWAQSAPSSTTQGVATQTTPDQPTTDDDKGEIVVTGSRTISNGNSAPTPVTIVSSAQLQETTPTNLSDGLKKLPVFANSGGDARTANTRDNTVGNYLNLRGLGPIRTLILLDGRRVPPTAASGIVDTNILPQQLIKRVDVVTGGVSAVYGSDAITGVVNFVLDTKLDGIRALAQAGISERGDAGNRKFGIAAGTSLFGGRGHIEASYDHLTQDGISSKLARESGTRTYVVLGQGTTTSPFTLFADARNSRTTFGGLISSGPLSGNTFTTPGTLVPFVNGASTGTVGVQVGGDGSYQSRSTLTSDLKTDQAFGRFDYDFSDGVKFFLQGGYARSEQRAAYVNLLMNGVTISNQNPFLPQAVRTAYANTPTFTFGRSFATRDPLRVDIQTSNYTGTAGVNGSFGKFRFELFYTRSQNRQYSRTTNNINSGRQAAALDVVLNNGVPVCRAALTNPSAYGDCVPFNPFGVGAESDAAVAYITGQTSYRLTTTLDDFGATIAGSPFSTWAGPVQVALNGEFRRNTLRNESDALPTTFANCAGQRYNCTATTAEWFQGSTANVRAAEQIAEGAGEIEIPLLKDSAVARSLSVNLAGRYAHYTVSGRSTTWKAGAVWDVAGGLSLRVTRSRDFRAPTLNDLYQPQTTLGSTYNDLHTSTSQLTTIITRGNDQLKPEISNTLTLGGVYRPTWLPRFSLAVDYFDIKLDNAITVVSGANGITQAECEQSGGTSPRCALYIRPLPFADRSPANFPTAVLSQPLNASKIQTRGIDVEANYSIPVGSTTVGLRAFLTYQPRLDVVQFPGAPSINNAGSATDFAKYRASVIANVDAPLWHLSVQERWRSSLLQSGNQTLVYAIGKVPSAAYTDVYLGIHPARRDFEFFVQVQNLFDKDPPVFALPGGAPGLNFPAVAGDDIIGRYFTGGVRIKF